MVRRIRLGLLFVLAGLASAQAAELTATVDRREVALQEHVVLTLSLINSDTRLRAEGVSPNVDLSVLTRDFDVGTPNVDNNYNIYRGRGRSTSKLSVDLFPRRSGRLVIPAFTVDGLHTAPITIDARGLPAGAMPEVFSRGGVSRQTVWQRQQLVAWLDVYHRVALKTASIGDYLSTEPAAIELLEHEDLPQSERKEKIKGVEYGVTRIAWALFPKDSGTLTLHLPDVWLVTADGRKLRLPDQRQQVTVRPLPAAVGDTIPVGAPQLAQTAPAPAPAENNLSTWTVAIRGPFSRFAFPETLPLGAAPDGIRLYSDRGERSDEPGTDALESVMTYTLSALPQHGGDFRLPPLRIPYFDPARGVLDVAELPGPRLHVASAPAAEPALEPAAANGVRAAGAADETEVKLVRRWQNIALAFAALWLLTLTRLRRRTQPPAPPANAGTTPRPAPPPSHPHPLKARLLGAFGSRTLEQGLNAWETVHGVDVPLRETVRAVQRLCYGQGGGADDSLIRAVEDAVQRIAGTAAPAAEEGGDPWQPQAFAVDPRTRAR